MTPSQADQAAAVLRLLRADWTRTRIDAVLADPKIQAQPGRTALVAAVLCATDPRATAPGFMLTDTSIWSAARRAIDPLATERPIPPKLVEMCICGRPQHDPNPACDEPRQAIRQKPADPAAVHAAVLEAKKAIHR